MSLLAFQFAQTGVNSCTCDRIPAWMGSQVRLGNARGSRDSTVARAPSTWPIIASMACHAGESRERSWPPRLLISSTS